MYNRTRPFHAMTVGFMRALLSASRSVTSVVNADHAPAVVLTDTLTALCVLTLWSSTTRTT